MPTFSALSSSEASTCAPGKLVGQWDFRRRLVDRRAGLLGRASGTLVIAPQGDGFRWHEVGELKWNGRGTPISRALGLALDDGEWRVTFADGRPFHPWRFGVPLIHPCGDDVYTGRVRMDRDGQRLRIGWDVAGPTKQQRIVTTYERVS